MIAPIVGWRVGYVLFGVALALLETPALAQTERHYQERYCDGLELEHVLPDRARVDCLSDTHAWEVDFSDKWAEALGQSLYYAAETGLLPAVLLICRQQPQTCLAHVRRLQRAAIHWDITIVVWLVDGSEP